MRLPVAEVDHAGCRDGLMVVLLGRGFIGGAIAHALGQTPRGAMTFSSHEADLRNPLSTVALLERIGDVPPDALVICASRVRLKGNSPDVYCDNLCIAANAARLVVALRPGLVVFFSTIDVYGKDPQLPITPESPVAPFDYYGHSKLISESILQDACRAEGIPCTVLRLAGVYGPDDGGHSAVSSLLNMSRAQPEIRLSNDGATLRDYIFIDDMVAIVRRVLATGLTGTFNAVTGLSRRMDDIVSAIVAAGGGRPRVTPVRERGPRDYDLVFDQSSFHAAFGPMDFTALEVALDTYQRVSA